MIIKVSTAVNKYLEAFKKEMIPLAKRWARKALPLKQVAESKDLIVESVAEDIISMTLENMIFLLPPEVKTVKSP